MTWDVDRANHACLQRNLGAAGAPIESNGTALEQVLPEMEQGENLLSELVVNERLMDGEPSPVSMGLRNRGMFKSSATPPPQSPCALILRIHNRLPTHRLPRLVPPRRRRLSPRTASAARRRQLPRRRRDVPVTAAGTTA